MINVEIDMQVDVVLGLHNSAGEAFNITHIAGSINSPKAFYYYVQNFTLQVRCCLTVALFQRPQQPVLHTRYYHADFQPALRSHTTLI